MIQKITTLLMFEGRYQEAMGLYVSVFGDAAVTGIRRHGLEGPGAEG